jgi:hypothetical protein
LDFLGDELNFTKKTKRNERKGKEKKEKSEREILGLSSSCVMFLSGRTAGVYGGRKIRDCTLK